MKITIPTYVGLLAYFNATGSEYQMRIPMCLLCLLHVCLNYRNTRPAE